ncbi:alpha/beta hydrolase [Agrobacterium tumefaciens]|uniref:alpha/beta hydrolase n=1 Tax=Agrobacterium tumefaciens TaxID=358 RepID=UPI0021CF2638|nr:dienelactone hydrolase family protein [Agrobacterium tumefaciens]UXS03951.1 prolyl oligopeptidase family serine peptidase [Agrobacterium tumefaciens]
MTEVGARNLVILLHGVGSNGANLAPLANLWNGLLPNTDFVSPDGPFAFGRGPGRQWFSIEGVTEQNRPDRVQAARGDFDRVIGEIISEHGLADNPQRVALVGFSQGSIMALDVLASGRLPVAAVAAFSGRLASPQPISPSPSTRLTLIHGDEDHIMPVSESVKASDIFKAAGVETELHVLPGLGHSISQDGAVIAGKFLQRAFGV